MEQQDRELLGKIKALAVVNREIIQRIRSKQEFRIKFNYTVIPGGATDKYLLANQSKLSTLFNRVGNTHQQQGMIVNNYNNQNEIAKQYFRVSTNAVYESAYNLLNKWQPKFQIQAIEDIFNDKINYNITNFEQLVTLNEEMLRVAQKYSLFDGTKSALAVLAQFLSNFEVIQLELGIIEESLTDAESQEDELTEEMNALNNEISALEQKLGAFFSKCTFVK